MACVTPSTLNERVGDFMTERVLSIENLQVQFKTYAGTVQAIRGVDFQLHKGETLAIVGNLVPVKP